MNATGNCKAPGRSCGGFGTKVCVAADGHDRARSFTLSPGQAHEQPSAYALLDDPPHPPTYAVCDCGYASHKFREYLMTQKLPVLNELTGTDTWSKICGLLQFLPDLTLLKVRISLYFLVPACSFFLLYGI